MAIVTFNQNTPAYCGTPADPTGTNNTTGLMMGLGSSAVLTPQFSGRVLVLITGNLTNSTGSAGNGAKVQIRHGSGAAPANGAALTGTAMGSTVTSVLERATANDLQAFALTTVVSGLPIGAARWFDISLAAVAAGTGLARNLNVCLVEL